VKHAHINYCKKLLRKNYDTLYEEELSKGIRLTQKSVTPPRGATKYKYSTVSLDFGGVLLHHKVR